MKRILIAFLFTATLYGQGAVRQYNSPSGPTGGCALNTLWVNSTTPTFSYCANGVWTTAGGGGGSGTVTTVAGMAFDAGLFSVTYTSPTTTPAVQVGFPSVAAHTFWGNNTSSSAPAAMLRLACADLSDSSTLCNTSTPLTESLGGTGANNTTGAAGHYLRSNGTHYVDNTIQVSDVPTLNQSTTGNANTATALASTPSNCGANVAATGVAANGNAVGCFTPTGGEGASGTGFANYIATFNSVTSFTILGTTHNFGTAALLISIYDNASPRNMIEAATVTVDPSTYNVVVTFNSAQSGTIIINGSGGTNVPIVQSTVASLNLGLQNIQGSITMEAVNPFGILNTSKNTGLLQPCNALRLTNCRTRNIN